MRFLPDLRHTLPEVRGLRGSDGCAAATVGGARRRHTQAAAHRLFQKAFLSNIRRNGRLNELELIGVFKFSTFLHGRSLSFLLKDATLAPQLMKRKKFHLVGEKAHDRAVVARIFARCMDDSLL
jgi:hypothetical protein